MEAVNSTGVQIAIRDKWQYIQCENLLKKYFFGLVNRSDTISEYYPQCIELSPSKTVQFYNAKFDENICVYSFEQFSAIFEKYLNIPITSKKKQYDPVLWG